MPLHPMRCLSEACGHLTEHFCRITETPACACEKCGAETRKEYHGHTTRTAETIFFERETLSWTQGFHKDEVPGMRRLFGDKGGQCIMENGDVRFAGSRERDAYQKKKRELLNSGQMFE